MTKMSKYFKVWSKFSAAKKSGEVINFRIVNMPENLKEDVMNLYTNYYVKEEAIFKAAGVPKSAKALKEVCEPIIKAVEKPGFYTVICSIDNDDEQIKNVVGASMKSVALKGDPEPEYKFQAQEVKKLFEITNDLKTYFDEVKVFNLDRYLSDQGLFICPEFRGLGIAQEFLKVSRMICKEHSIPIHGGWMTSYGTLKAAERDRWETVCEIPIEELGRKHGVTFEDDLTSYKYMIARIDKNN